MAMMYETLIVIIYVIEGIERGFYPDRLEILA